MPSSVPRKGKGANKMGCVITDADWISSTASESRYLRKEEGKQSENRKSKCSSSYDSVTHICCMLREVRTGKVTIVIVETF